MDDDLQDLTLTDITEFIAIVPRMMPRWTEEQYEVSPSSGRKEHYKRKKQAE
jgi:hypothetical protein